MSMPEAQLDNMVGRLVLGRYRIVRLLARGGMGSIYLARNKGAAGFVRPAVVKKVLPSYLGDDSAVQMFAREARIMANLRHPGIVNIIDFAEEDGAYVMVMEYVHGTHTGRWVRYLRKVDRPFPVELGIQILVETLEALDYAHTATALDGTPLGVIHRDIKPSNILVDVTGHVKLADFGIARAPNDRTEVSSGSTKLKGTFPYLAPEVFDEAEPSPGTDVYACGVVLHTLLSGRNEFSAKEVSTTIMRVLEHTATPLDQVRSDVSPELAAVVARSISKDPAERYSTAAELAAALRQVRTISEAEANDLLRQSAMRDFRDERFAQLLRIDDLGTLERALNEEGDEIELTAQLPMGEFETEPSLASFESGDVPTPGTVPSGADASGPLVAPSDDYEQPTRAERRASTAEEQTPAAASLAGLPQPPSTRRTWPIIVAMLVAAAIIGGGVVVASILFNKNKGEPAQVIVVDQKGEEGGSEGQQSKQPSTEPERLDGEDTGTDIDAGTEETGKKRNERNRPKTFNLQRAIDSAMAKRSSAFQSCFQKHPDLSKQIRRVSLKIKVAASGKVQSASVQNPKVSGAQLGKCLVQVARGTRFGKLPKAIGFSIPLRTNIR